MAYQSIIKRNEIRISSTQPLDEVLIKCWPETRDYRMVQFTTAAPVDLGECIVTLKNRYQQFQSIHPEYTLLRTGGSLWLKCRDIPIEQAFTILQKYYEVSEANPGRYKFQYSHPGIAQYEHDMSQVLRLSVTNLSIVDQLIECMGGMTVKFRVQDAGRFIDLPNVTGQLENDLELKMVNGVAKITMEIIPEYIEFVRTIPYPKHIRYSPTDEPDWKAFVTIPNITRFITSTFPSDYTGIPVFIDLDLANNSWTYPEFAGVYLNSPNIQDGRLRLDYGVYRNVDKLLQRVRTQVCNDTPYRDVLVILWVANANITTYPLATFSYDGVIFNAHTPIGDVPQSYQNAIRQIREHLSMQGVEVQRVFYNQVPGLEIKEVENKVKEFLGFRPNV